MTDRPSDRQAALDEVSRLAAGSAPLAATEVDALLRAAAGGDAGALEDLVSHHLWLVRDAVLARKDSGVTVADLFQEGSAGLVLGLQRHLASDGAAATLSRTLREAVEEELDRAEALEREYRAEEARWVADSESFAAAEGRLRLEKGRPPTTGDLALQLGWDEEHVDRVREMVTRAQAAHDVDLLSIISELDDSVGAVDDEGG